jgi:hypothetical protein
MKQNDKTLKNDGSWLIKKEVFLALQKLNFCGCLDDMNFFLVKINITKNFL